MPQEILKEIVIDTISDIHYILQTRLPYPWDFCRVDLEPSSRLLLNSGSYFVVYAAFIHWFIKLVVKRLNSLNEDTTIKDFLIVTIFSLVTASQVLWPFFLISMYIITCSFYPWISALAVLFLNFPLQMQTLFLLTVNNTADFFQASMLSISLDGLVSEREPSFESIEIPVGDSVNEDSVFTPRITSTEEDLLLDSNVSHSTAKSASEDHLGSAAATREMAPTPLPTAQLKEFRFDDYKTMEDVAVSSRFRESKDGMELIEWHGTNEVLDLDIPYVKRSMEEIDFEDVEDIIVGNRKRGIGYVKRVRRCLYLRQKPLSCGVQNKGKKVIVADVGQLVTYPSKKDFLDSENPILLAVERYTGRKCDS